LYPVSIQPALANLYLANGYRHHVEDVRRATTSFEKGLSLNTYADIEYGYQAYEMYTSHQVVMLAGEERVFAYRFALETLTANFNRYTYDGRTAMYLAHVLDLTPPEVERDEAFEREVINRATELSPKRLQSWFILANISLRKGDTAGSVSEKSRWYKEATGIIEEYAQLVPASAEPRYVLANIYFSLGDVVRAKKWADEGLPLYTHLDVEAARRAFRYYIAVEDWPHAERFMKDILGEEPDNYPLLYDFAKVRFLQGAREEALAIVGRLRIVAPELVASDPAFLQAIGQ
jgi:tetratricopeptide (TPR) repeat protein